MGILKQITIIILLLTSNAAAAKSSYLSELPGRSTKPAASFRADSVRHILSQLPLHHIEGVWQFTGNGTEIAIIRREPTLSAIASKPIVYEIILLQSPDRALRPGTVIGLVTPSAKSDTYQARIYTKSSSSTLFSPRNFLLKLDKEESRLVFDKKKNEYGLNLWRLIPYAWRYSIHRNNQGTSNEGCIRIFPAPELPIEPIYL
ncbi:MAG: hypothetical protein NC338_02815 [Firmicutes bacterium]|nr:hypothetical protein [Bacillota bacterium]MCM1400878.1 hypothetical protein [Bacteroides sp.]MCM1476627.1 hypothetical protein [Bacteroides sp.]